MNRGRTREIALVGMACRFAGAPDLFAFWANSLANRDVTSESDSESHPSLVNDAVVAALADASMTPESLDRLRVELFIAIAGVLADRPLVRGACYMIDAGSASSLIAMDLASRALFERRADVSLVVGVHKEADGPLPRGEVGVVVLKRLRDAERDGDRIYAVLKGIGLANAEPSGELTSPSSKGQARAIRKAYRSSRIDPVTVGLIEGFASGVPAAGMAGLIKTALALHHRLLPPAGIADHLDSTIARSGFKQLPAARPWIHGDSQNPRRAGVNSFGLAGMSAHAVLEEHPASADGITPGALLDWDSEAFLLSADDRAGLVDRVRWLRDRLIGARGHSLKDIAFSINLVSPAPTAHARLGIVAASRDELAGHLDAVEHRLRDPSRRQVRDGRGLYYWEQPLGRAGTLAFLFPGEGSQYPGMLADLCPHFPELRAVFDTADRIARESGEEVPPSRHLFGSSGSVPQALWATDTAVTAVLSSQWAIFQVLKRLGLSPDAVAGHSSGELPALAAAGVLRTEQSLERQLIRLAAIFRELEASGAIPSARLVAAGTDRDRAELACRAGGQSVVVAIDNCPHQVVLAGPPGEVDLVVAQLRTAGVVCEELPFARAYHTPGFAAVLEPLAAFYGSLEMHTAGVPIYSCSTAGRMPESLDEVRRLAVAQWTCPVAFRDTIEAMYRDGLRVFVDVGARGNLCGYVDDILRGRPAFAVAANLPRRSGTTQLNHLVASLFAQGLLLDPTYLYARRRPKRIDLNKKPSSQPTFAERETEALTKRLRHEGNGHPNGTGLHSRNGHQSRNGHVNGHEIDLPTALARSLMPDQAMIEATQNAAHPSLTHNEVILGFLGTMTAFLSTQQQVMQAYLLGDRDTSAGDPREGARPGPWIGTIREWEPGRKIVSRLALDGIDDPVAENHTLGGRRVSALDTTRKGLPVVPFSVMAEIVAQAGALIVAPGLVLESLREVRAHRWVTYGRGGVLEIRGERDGVDPQLVHVTLSHAQGEEFPGSDRRRLVYEGTARFAEQPLESIAASEFELADPRTSKFTAERLYDEQWLFHGPPMQALTEVGPVSQDGISGAIAVLPLAGLTRAAEPVFYTHPITLDTFTHLLGCWGLDCLEQGDVVFPLTMGELSIHGAAPATGTIVACRVLVRDVQQYCIRVDAELVRPDGLVWMRISDWEDWRFHWPARYRDVFRSPDTILIGEELPISGASSQDITAVWLAPPGDMARPVWRDVLEQIQLGPEEQAACLALGGPEIERTLRLWGRIAAKEAARRLWLAAGDPPRYPADLAIVDDAGRPRFRDLARPERNDLPAVSIAHTDGIVVALAAREPGTPVGIGIEPVRERTEASDPLALTDGEVAVLPSDVQTSRCEWIARFRAARQAAIKASGLIATADLSDAKVIAADVDTGAVLVLLQGGRGSVPSILAGATIRVMTATRGDHAWAWTLGEEVDKS